MKAVAVIVSMINPPYGYRGQSLVVARVGFLQMFTHEKPIGHLVLAATGLGLDYTMQQDDL